MRQGKRFELDVEGEISESRRAQLDEIAEKLLSNPVIEDYSIEVDDTQQVTA